MLHCKSFRRTLPRPFRLQILFGKVGARGDEGVFAKYLAQYLMVHPNNYRGSWLPKVGGERQADIEWIFRKREHFIMIFADGS